MIDTASAGTDNPLYRDFSSHISHNSRPERQWQYLEVADQAGEGGRHSAVAAAEVQKRPQVGNQNDDVL